MQSAIGLAKLGAIDRQPVQPHAALEVRAIVEFVLRLLFGILRTALRTG